MSFCEIAYSTQPGGFEASALVEEVAQAGDFALQRPCKGNLQFSLYVDSAGGASRARHVSTTSSGDPLQAQ